MSNGEVVYTNNYYTVIIGEAEITDCSALLYKVINRRYEQVEAEMSALPTAIMAADEFEDYLNVVYKNSTPEPELDPDDTRSLN